MIPKMSFLKIMPFVQLAVLKPRLASFGNFVVGQKFYLSFVFALDLFFLVSETYSFFSTKFEKLNQNLKKLILNLLKN